MASPKRAASDLLERFAFALEILEGPTPAARAYGRSARTVAMLDGDLATMHADGSLAEVRGLGAAAMRAIVAALESRVPDDLVALEARIPPGLFELRRVRGLGPAKIRAVYEGLGVASLGELEHACNENRLVTLPGFGDKTQKNVAAAIEAIRASEGLLHRHRALEAARAAIAQLESAGLVAQIAGDLARGAELIADLTIVVAGDASAIETVRAALGPASPVRLEACERASLGVAAVWASSSAAHRDALVAHAASRGDELGAAGLKRDGALVACETEDALYRALGLVPTPAERREPEIPLVHEGRAAPRRVELRDLRGALHNHTTASDGTASLEEMRAAAEALGLEYLGISEHSPSAAYARGLSAERLAQQIEEIARQPAGRCVLLTGIESDIRPDGTLDYDDDVLARLEVVIASVHRRHGLDRAATTERMVAAAKNPRTKIVGHPTGRLLLGRAPNDFDIGAFLDACAESGCAVELNSSPHRLDLDARWLGEAKERGVLVSIAADAHATNELTWLEHGVAIARRAGLTADDVLNARPLDALPWRARA